jgi:hypothetical protein
MGIVASRFTSKRDAEKALRNIDPSERCNFVIVDIDDPRVTRYYDKVNKVRVKSGLKPIDPRYPVKRM